MLHDSGDAREQPLFFLITTAETDVNSVCWEVHQKAEDILKGRKRDPISYPVIYGVPADADWTSDEVWKAANLSLGITGDIKNSKTPAKVPSKIPQKKTCLGSLDSINA